MGEGGAAACLAAGANDLGGTLMNESITRAAGAVHGQEMPPESMEALIRSLGREPRSARRSTPTPPRSERPPPSALPSWPSRSTRRRAAMSGTRSTPPPTIEDDRAAPVKFPLNRNFCKLTGETIRGTENSSYRRLFASLATARHCAAFVALEWRRASGHHSLRIAQIDLGGDLKSARLKEARLDRRESEPPLA